MDLIVFAFDVLKSRVDLTVEINRVKSYVCFVSIDFPYTYLTLIR